MTIPSVGAAGFEPATLPTQRRDALTGLSSFFTLLQISACTSFFIIRSF
jgi:hypothetical protein